MFFWIFISTRRRLFFINFHSKTHGLSLYNILQVTINLGVSGSRVCGVHKQTYVQDFQSKNATQTTNKSILYRERHPLPSIHLNQMSWLISQVYQNYVTNRSAKFKHNSLSLYTLSQNHLQLHQEFKGRYNPVEWTRFFSAWC